MPPRSAWALALIAIQVVALGSAPYGHAQTAAAPFDLGLGPGALFPADSGIPVYAPGDQLWARSHLNYSVLVAVGPAQFPGGVLKYAVLRPDIPDLVYQFNPTDRAGLWDFSPVNVTGGSSSSLYFVLSSSSLTSPDLTMTGSGIAGGRLAMNFSVSPQLQFYDGSACLLGGQDPAAAMVSVPGPLGGGEVSIEKLGPTVFVSAQGLVNRTFFLSVELFYNYSFTTAISSTVYFSRGVRAAESGVVSLSASAHAGSAPLSEDVPLRPGVYEVRVFFVGAGGSYLATTEVVIPGGPGWVWTGLCQRFPVYSNSFGLSPALGPDPAAWPRALVFTYESGGLEGIAQIDLGLNLSVARFVASPWGGALSGYSLEASGVAGVKTVDVADGSVYAILSGGQADASYTLSLGGRPEFQGMVAMAPFEVVTVPVNVSRLVVIYEVKGSPYEGGGVAVGDQAGNLTSSSTDRNGEALFYLPPGSYTVSGSGGNISAKAGVILSEGQSIDITLGLEGAGGVPSYLVLGLAGSAVVGVVLDLYLVAGRRRRRVHHGPAGPTLPSQK